MKHILLTGASGFLGKIIKEHLKSDLSMGVITLGRDKSNQICYDLGKMEAKIALPPRIDMVVHVAGKVHSIPKTPAERQEFMDVNFMGTVNLCNSIAELEVLPKQFVFISTVAVYGADNGEMITEEHPLNGNSPYALSKIKAEEYLANWAKNNNVILTILRLPLVAGSNAPGNLGAMVNGIKEGRYLSIGHADASKSVIWADDVAKVIPVVASIGGVYNITDGQHPTFKQLETVIANTLNKSQPPAIPLFVARLLSLLGNLLGKRAPINSDKLRKITSTLTFNDRKLHNVIDWKPSSVLDKLRQTL